MNNTGEKNIDLKVNDSPSIDATVTTVTDEIDFSRSYEWSVTGKKIGTNGDPIVHIEGKNGDGEWVTPYVDGDGNEVTWTLDDLNNNSIFDQMFAFSKFRLRTEPNGNTAGTVEYQLTLYID